VEKLLRFADRAADGDAMAAACEMLADRDAPAGIALNQQNIHPHLSPPQ
jgi:hypothetical protein